MRHYQKKEILAIISLLHKSHEVIRKCVDARKYENACFMIQECQQSAIDVGNLIEEVEGEGTSAVFCMEQYCEQLYQVDLAVHNLEPYRLYKQLEKSLNAIEKSIKYDIKSDKLEILFLPYKADMWTSLESIWKEAVLNERCNVKVVVVPYFFLDLSTNKTEFRYEGERFPDYVEVIHFDKYDIPAIHPDMIFIHNPYDATNTLTEIPERYHSSNLAQHTDLLVYSPYGNFGVFNPAKTPFMCCVNALNYVDKILVQSEKVKRLYMDSGVPEDKLVALGSPKTDAIISSMKSKKDIPELWAKKFAGRKVILFNTHLSYFTRAHYYAQKNNTENYGINVHRRFFNEMNNYNGFGIIWRPHPLMKDMLRSRGLTYILTFVEELEELVQGSTNMVLDTYGDYTVAFQCSDAFMTTYTSLISEYMLTGKPVGIYQRKYKFLNEPFQPVSYLNNYFVVAESVQKTGGNVIYRKDFLQMLLEGRDPLKEDRMQDIKRAFCNCDGTVGKKVWEQMIKELKY